MRYIINERLLDVYQPRPGLDTLLKDIPEQRYQQPETGRPRGTLMKILGGWIVPDLALSGDFNVAASAIHF